MKLEQILKNSINVKNITNFITAVLPSYLNYYLIREHVESGQNIDVESIAYCALLGATTSFFLATIIPYILVMFKKCRSFSKYEGRWLQIIPDMEERPFTIVDLRYNKHEEKYEIHGNNYSKDLQQNVDFDAYYIVERRFKNGFYYITDQTTDYTNGLGKVCFVQSNDDNLIRAKGYFFDESTKMCSKKYKTYFIKCDKNFFDMINGGKNYMKIRKMSPKHVMDCCKDFALQELNRYCPQQAENKLLCENCKNGNCKVDI